MHEAASSSTDGAKRTEEKGVDIDQIVTEAWGERGSQTPTVRDRKMKDPWSATGTMENPWSATGNGKSMEHDRKPETSMEHEVNNDKPMGCDRKH